VRRGISESLTKPSLSLAQILCKGQKRCPKPLVNPDIFSRGMCVNDAVWRKSPSNLQRVETVQHRYSGIKELLTRHGNQKDFLLQIGTES